MMTLATRTIAVHALRTTTATQITATCADHTGGRCAIGVIAEAFGCDPTDPCSDPYRFIERYGIRFLPIYRMNDGRDDQHRYTFAEIADYLETLPVTDPMPDTTPSNTPIKVSV